MQNCPRCGRSLYHPHLLVAHVEAKKLTIGKAYKGRQIRELVE